MVIHHGYAHGKHGYRAVAYVAEWIGGKIVRHTHRIGLGDSAREAISDAVAYVQDTYARDGLVGVFLDVIVGLAGHLCA